jgi:hypothetical protein
MKRCSKCGRMLDLNRFSVDKVEAQWPQELVPGLR